MRMIKSIVIYAAAVFFIYGTANADSVLIANNSVKQSSVTKDDVNLIFLGKEKKHR